MTPFPPLPARIGPYPIRGLLGAGSMGQVYLGHDPMIDRPVAVKVIQQRDAPDDDPAVPGQAMARFRVEAQAAGRLNHPGIVAIYQFGEDQGRAYLAMEYVTGSSLREHLARGPRFTPAEVVCVMDQLLDALHFAHGRGVVHRDIKPANLIVTREGRLKVTDFGIARMDSSPMTRDVTRTHLIVGTPGYMAPEQYTGGTIDRRADLFAAGVLLYQLLTGQAPYSGRDESVMYQIVYGEVPLLPAAEGDTAARDGFNRVLARALAKQPGERYDSAAAMREAVLALADGPVPAALARPPLAQREAPGVPVTGATSPSPPSAPVPTGWNEATLHGIERELAAHVGPMARVLVRRAARGHTTLEAVRLELARIIQDPAARERFLRADATGPSAARGNPPRVTQPGAAPTQALRETLPAMTGTPLLPDDVERVGQALARVLGPITKVLVRRCAAQARTRETLVAQLLAQLDPGLDLRAIEASLWQALNRR